MKPLTIGRLARYAGGLLALSGLLVTIAVSGTARAAESGFGVYGGFARHQSQGEFTEAPLDGVEFEFSSSGLSYGIDYQIALGDSFSLNPFLMSSTEQFEEESEVFGGFGIEPEDGRHTILGLQLRLWFDSVFVGAHVGSYTEVINFDNGEDAGFAGAGGGLAAGWEADSGWFLTAQADAASLEDEDDAATTELTGFRLHIGYRWK